VNTSRLLIATLTISLFAFNVSADLNTGNINSGVSAYKSVNSNTPKYKVGHLGLKTVIKPLVSMSRALSSKLLAPQNTAFVLGDIYTYPNPAKLTQPTFHVETGIADAVNIKVFNIAGEKVYDTDLGGQPLLNNNKYSYEHKLDKTLASGVYICYVKTSKSGEGDLTRTFKFAIIR
jgi:hypothetical protein